MDETLLFNNADAWADWLREHHANVADVWLRLGKKGSREKAVVYAEALEVALCFGWIDGQKKSYSEHQFLQRFCPRGARSIWSKINREKALALIESGTMQAAGLVQIERAKADGRWDSAYAGSRTIEVPEDLQFALDAVPKALAFFKTLNSQNRYAILFRIGNVKKAETRAKKIKAFVEMLRKGEKIHP
jgi:uncharacterized protein YdeI (YjbR/CyaY-like superfamily)